jgi:serine phosphatase RsbU (regulator of sigma subunit)
MPQVAFTQGTTRLVTDVRARLASWRHAEPAVADIIERVRAENAIVAPLLVNRRPVGVAVLGRGEGRRCFTEKDVAVIEAFSRRLAVGLAHVETFTREHTAAEILQDALLPHALPEAAGLDLAVRYLPATDGLHVGGDWYDAFPMGYRRVGLVIGDVAGHSIESAAIMGQIRTLLRAHALGYESPADVLGQTNASMSQLLPEATATVFHGVLDVQTGDLVYANAGHPPAVLATGDGHAEYLESPAGIMLGACADTTYAAGDRHLPPGASLLLYTDGLIEDRRRDITDGLSALADAMRLSPAHTAERTCECVQKALLGSGTRADDICILALHIQDETSRAAASR